MSSRIPRPGPDEYAPYYDRYVSLVAEEDVAARLAGQPAALRASCGGLTGAEALHRYAPGKWSVKEVLGHLTDSERIFSYRVLRIARGDATPLSSFEENAYVAAGGFDRLPLEALLADFQLVRAATLSLLRQLEPGTLERRGVASENPISARAMLYVIAGHVEHHHRILRERYGLGEPLSPGSAGEPAR